MNRKIISVTNFINNFIYELTVINFEKYSLQLIFENTSLLTIRFFYEKIQPK